MRKSSLKVFFILVTSILLFLNASCTANPVPSKSPDRTASPLQASATVDVATPSPSPLPPRVLTVCMVGEPASLFLYSDQSLAARSVRQAIYDGPYDVLNFDISPVIWTEKPTIENGDAQLSPVEVKAGSLIRDANGGLATLDQGVSYQPSGCSDASCAQMYAGNSPVKMDQLSVRFHLLPNLRWSDGSPLSADDSQYSYEVAKALYPQARADLIARTQSYQALDASTVEWRGIPGDRDPLYTTNFFTPLPRHAWGSLQPQELGAAEISSRSPIGWGPYRIDEWTSGDHITLSRNPTYFRSAEGLPHFDRLVYRFMQNGSEALTALTAGECDFVDESANLETLEDQILQLQKEGKIAVQFKTGTAWEHADFGLQTLNTQAQPLFQSKEIRQAIATCIDRQKMASELFLGKSQVLDSFVPPDHPLYNPEVQKYSFDPQAAAQRLQAAGWVDPDNNPSTPRIASGVPGVADGIPFEFDYLVPDEGEKPQAAQILKDSLAQCGIRVNVRPQSTDQLFAPGPDGPVFGREFVMAQFAWVTSLQPPCFLYTTGEIPGPFPDYPKGWGGANVTGYSSPEYDQVCQAALTTLPDSPDYQKLYRQAQEIFAQDLPAIPLYLHLKVVAMRPDMCSVKVDPSADSSLWNLEAMDYGKACQP
jgi:peptide/nickel transport system substrate-binding protein